MFFVQFSVDGTQPTLQLQEKAATQQDRGGGSAGREDARTGEPTHQRLSGSRLQGVVGGFASCYGVTYALSHECLELKGVGMGLDCVFFASDEPQSLTGPSRPDVKKTKAQGSNQTSLFLSPRYLPLRSQEATGSSFPAPDWP